MLNNQIRTPPATHGMSVGQRLRAAGVPLETALFFVKTSAPRVSSVQTLAEPHAQVAAPMSELEADFARRRQALSGLGAMPVMAEAGDKVAASYGQAANEDLDESFARHRLAVVDYQLSQLDTVATA